MSDLAKLLELIWILPCLFSFCSHFNFLNTCISSWNLRWFWCFNDHGWCTHENKNNSGSVNSNSGLPVYFNALIFQFKYYCFWLIVEARDGIYDYLSSAHNGLQNKIKMPILVSHYFVGILSVWVHFPAHENHFIPTVYTAAGFSIQFCKAIAELFSAVRGSVTRPKAVWLRSCGPKWPGGSGGMHPRRFFNQDAHKDGICKQLGPNCSEFNKAFMLLHCRLGISNKVLTQSLCGQAMWQQNPRKVRFSKAISIKYVFFSS